MDHAFKIVNSAGDMLGVVVPLPNGAKSFLPQFTHRPVVMVGYGFPSEDAAAELNKRLKPAPTVAATVAPTEIL